MASDIEASCENDPNFAVICAFLEKFGAKCGLPTVDFLELQKMLENSEEVPSHLHQLILKLLRRVKKSVKNDKWEKALVSVCHSFSSQDAWEIERFGYKKAKLTSKVRALKELLEMQFDHHVKFKNEVNKLTAEELRSQPLGRDKAGHAYWFHSDDNYQIRVYKEDLDEETWTLIAKDRESLVSLITKLNDGECKFSSDSAANEDSNSLSEKPVIDTGQTDIDSNNKASEESENSTESKEKSESVEENNSLNKPDLKIKQKIMDTENPDEKPKVKSSEENLEDCSEESKEESKDATDEKPRPLLRIKNLSELMGGNNKRSRFNDDDEPQGKEIEGPLMQVQGEGSGAENEGACQNFPEKCLRVGESGNSEESPIVGEAIEEGTVYFYGEGCGAECHTGNEKNDPTNEIQTQSETSNKSNTQNEYVNSSSSTDSIKDNLSNFKDNNDKAKEVPSIKLGTIFDSKTDNNTKLPTSPSRKSRWDVEKLEQNDADGKGSETPPAPTGKVNDIVSKFEQASSPTQETEVKSSPTTSKKPMFFFGSASLKTTCISPLVSFGGNSPKQEVNVSKCDNHEEDLKESEVNTKSNEKLEKDVATNVDETDEKESEHSSSSKEQGKVEEMNDTQSLQCGEGKSSNTSSDKMDPCSSKETLNNSDDLTPKLPTMHQIKRLI
ncbi:hypothetical protein NQ318_016892 [Aromia moschata]|uniref:Remodeling and spacing factor 1 n=1 Tax=Aromia moschata TaxID=1265417 RepID=A0AAV8XR69_9CUCU|nr:hypothetical protein NQ318_016892 [Aromia moschata]